MRYFRLALGAILLTGLLAGCGQQAPAPHGTSTPEAPSKTTLGVIPKSTGNEFWETVETGARGAAEALGMEMKWEGTVTETEIAEQNKIIENMINLGVDGIALAPLNQKAQAKLVAQAVEAGIPVVVFDSAVDGDAHASFVATDNKKGGGVGAEHLVSLLGGQGKVMVLRFVQGTGSTEARAEGFIEVAKAGGLEVVADAYPDQGTIEGAKNVAANTLEGFVKVGKLELNGIFACNLVSTLGMASALDDLRKGGIEVDVKFVGFDTSKKLVEGVQDGSIDGLVAQDPEKMGKLAVETLAKVVAGESVDAMIDTGVTLVTKDGLENDAAMRALVGLE
jgi:ribose transport system substrate-binding protein